MELLSERPSSLVYKENRDGQPVVIKVLNRETPTTMELHRFFNDFQAVEGMSHSGMRSAISKERLDGRHALVLEYVSGEPLSNLAGELQLRQVLDIGVQVAEVLAYLHSQRVIHRDVNPSNVIYDGETGKATLIDYELASSVDLRPSNLSGRARLEGTLAYISPEQTGRLNRTLDYRTDLYSLGVSLYQLLTGRLPFPSQDTLELIHCHLAKSPLDVHRVDPSIPVQVGAIVARLLQKDPELRYQSAVGLAADLRRCLEELSATGNVPPFPVGERDRVGRLVLPQRLYGREAALGRLRAQIAGGRAGGKSFGWVAGYSGVGKSAVVRQIQAEVAGARGIYLEGKFEKLKRGVPYSAVVQAFSALIQEWLATDAAFLRAQQERILAAVGGLGRVLTSLVPDLELVIGSQPEVVELQGEKALARFKLILRKFVGVLCTAEHPLVLFLDDLQWADQASLDFLEALAVDEELGFLNVVGAYRSNEVDQSHPLMALVKRFGDKPILLAGLEQEHVVQLIADSLDSGPDEVAPLADLVFEKTNGNAFFVRQILLRIYERGHLSLNDAGRWDWDISDIRSLALSDNVVELMLETVKQLPEDTKSALMWAACVGNAFDADVVARAAGINADSVQRYLQPAVLEGLLSRSDEAGVAFRFAHDQIHHAAYGLIAEADQPTHHLQIARVLRRGLEAHGSAGLFAVVNHFAAASRLLTETKERLAVAKLYRSAADRAYDAAAFDQALRYYEKGIELLPDGSWASDYELSAGLTRGAMLSSYMRADYTLMKLYGQRLETRAKSVVEVVPYYDCQLMEGIGRDDLAGSINVGRKALKALGVDLPAKARPPHVLAELVAVKTALRGKRPEFLLTMPEVTDPKIATAMGMLARLQPAAYRLGGQLFPLIVLRTVRLALKHGVNSVASFAFSSYSIMLTGVFGDIEQGYQFGKAARELSRRFPFDHHSAGAHFIFENFIRHWKEPLKATHKPFLRVHHKALEVGDAYTAKWAALYRMYWVFFSGVPLGEVSALAADTAPIFRNDYDAEQVCHMLQQMVANLQASGDLSLELAGEHFDEHASQEELKDGVDKTRRFTYLLNKMVLAAHAGAWGQVASLALKMKSCEDAALATPQIPAYRFYAGIARCAARPGKLELAKMMPLRRTFRKWAETCPENFAHRHWALEAEVAALRGKTAQAREYFEKAGELAQQAGYLSEEALIWQRASSFARNLGRARLLSTYERQTSAAYQAWGATSKTRQAPAVSAARPSLREMTQAHTETSATTATTTGGTSTRALDLGSVLKAAGAIAAEIQLDPLVERLMRVVVENAGAQWGAMLMVKGERVELAAEYELSGDRFERHRALGLADAAEWLLEPAVRYAQRTSKVTLVEDAAADPRFAKSPYLQTRRVCSVAVVPIVHQGNLSALVYLENNLAAGVFTEERLEVVSALSSQAAIALENARLYSRLDRALQSQVELTNAMQRFVPSEFLHHMSRENIARVALGDSVERRMGVLFSDIRAFTSHVEGMSPQANIGFINRYLSRMEPPIMQNGGFVDSYIGDAIMALFAKGPLPGVRAGLEMLAALRELNRERASEGDIPIAVGIGVHYGPLTLGTIGGENRIKCGVIGDSVNLAARVESLTKAYDCELLISEEVRKALGPQTGPFQTRMVDKARVKGKVKPVVLYEVYNQNEPELAAAKAQVHERWLEMWESYLARDFANAGALLKDIRLKLPKDKVCELLAARIERYLVDAPGEDWDGVETLSHK